MDIRYAVEKEFLELHSIYYSSIHEYAKHVYSLDQLQAWAPEIYDVNLWLERMKKIRPMILVYQGHIVAYSDLQDDGYIDHFFVRGGEGRKGYGSYLLTFIIQQAKAKGIKQLYSQVSLAAEGLFLQHGFTIEKRQEVECRGSMLKNAKMTLRL